MPTGSAEVLGLSPEKTSLLLTGADMKNLAVESAEYKSFKAYALATAGAKSNALRASVEEGKYLEPGTINIIVLTNRSLTPRAMSPGHNHRHRGQDRGPAGFGRALHAKATFVPGHGHGHG